MPTIQPSLIPTIAPGEIFSTFVSDQTLNIRWITALDPVYYEVMNRPLADLTVRQLILSKAIDTLELSLGHQAIFPFLIQPQVTSGTTVVDLPPNWIWDLQASLPKKWEQVRLAKIKRISGTNDSTSDYTGKLRLIFTANEQNSAVEVAIFYVDYRIDSNLTYQPQRLNVVTTLEENTAIATGEVETVAGFIVFRTLDLTSTVVQNFLDTIAPPTDTTDSNSDGLYDNPAIYETVDSVPGGAAVTGDFAVEIMSHGSGLLVNSAWNSIPQLDSDIQSWLISFNYPFDAEATRTSTTSLVIPAGIFREFDICAPAGDEPTGDTTGTFFPVWISRIERIGTGSNQLRFYFATHNVTDSVAGGSPSLQTIEFATLDLLRALTPGEVVEIVPADNLQLETGDGWGQHFGRGHVTLSSLWARTTSEIDDFFDAFDSIVDTPADTSFSASSTRISSFGISRTPKYIPTIGQSRALLGSTSRRTVPVEPSYDNRYVTEADQGEGSRIDLEAQSGITSHVALNRYGYTGSLCHKLIRLEIDATQLGSDPNFYQNELLPRMQILLGRLPVFGDMWFDGTVFKIYNGSQWQTS